MINESRTSRVSPKYPMYFIDQFLNKPTESKFNNLMYVIDKNKIESEVIKTENRHIPNQKIKSKALSLLNEPKKTSKENNYKINFFSPKNQKIKKIHNLTERSQKTEKKTKTEFIANKPIDKNKFIKNSFLSNKVDTEANPPFTKVTNSLFKTIKNTFERRKTLEGKTLEEKTFDAKNNNVKKGKTINLQYNPTVKPKEKKLVSFKQIIMKAKMLNVVSSRELSVESRKLMLKRNSANIFFSGRTTTREEKHKRLNNTGGINEIIGGRLNTLNTQNTISNKTHDYMISESYLHTTTNKTEGCIILGFINNKYKGLIDMFFNNTKDKILSIQIVE